MGFLEKTVSPKTRASLAILYFGLTRVPMIFYVRPSVVEITAEQVVVKVPLKRRTKNHLNSMYFGALAVGADCTAGIMAVREIRRRAEPISLVFKDIKADFLKRAEADVYFSCTQGREIAALVSRAAETDERVELPVQVTAIMPDLSDEPVADFVLTLSLKKRLTK